MPDHCPDHDQCFEKLDRKLEKIAADIKDIGVSLAEGAGVHQLHDHRLKIIERLVFGLIGFIGAAVLGALISPVFKG